MLKTYKLSQTQIKFLLKITRVAATINVDTLVISADCARGVSADGALLLYADCGIPQFKTDIILPEISQFNKVTKLINCDDYDFYQECDMDSFLATNITFCTDTNSFKHNCLGSTRNLNIPVHINDNPKPVGNYKKPEVALLKRIRSALTADTITLAASPAGLLATILSSNGESTVTLTTDKHNSFKFNYKAANLLTILTVEEASTIHIGPKGLLQIVSENIPLYLMPRQDIR